MIVADTSALLGAWYAHYLPGCIDGFWSFLGEAIKEGRVVIPREVFVELSEQGDHVHSWVKSGFRDRVIEPAEEAQTLAGDLLATYRFQPGRDRADPFVIGEAKLRGFAVATYEGRSPTGTVAKSKAKFDNIPGICAAIGVTCLQPGLAWQHAGLRL